MEISLYVIMFPSDVIFYKDVITQSWLQSLSWCFWLSRDLAPLFISLQPFSVACLEIGCLGDICHSCHFIYFAVFSKVFMMTHSHTSIISQLLPYQIVSCDYPVFIEIVIISGCPQGYHNLGMWECSFHFLYYFTHRTCTSKTRHTFHTIRDFVDTHFPDISVLLSFSSI